MSRIWRGPAFFLVVALGFGLLAHRAQRAADAIRGAGGNLDERVFLPDPEALRVATMGYQGAASDLLWVRTVLAFADLVDRPDPEGTRWLRVMVQTVVSLDPGWRSSYMYGGGMLRSLNDIEGSDEVFAEGVEHLPEDPTFPFALAMNAYLYREDLEDAVRYMEQAAALPRAPAWYRSAAAGFLDRRGQREAALRYLEEEIEAESDPDLRAELERKYREVVHDELAARISEALGAARARRGDPSLGLEAIRDLPPDPLGGQWILTPRGEVRSSVRDAVLAERARRSERAVLLRLWREELAEP